MKRNESRHPAKGARSAVNRHEDRDDGVPGGVVTLAIRGEKHSAVDLPVVGGALPAQVWQQTALDTELSQTILDAGKARDQRALYGYVKQLRELAAAAGWMGGW